MNLFLFLVAFANTLLLSGCGGKLSLTEAMFVAWHKDHTCETTKTGVAKCWGLGMNGQLGDGKNLSSSVPVDVFRLTNSVKGISTGGDHTCAVLSEGAVKCWGRNFYGQLGNGTASENSPTPVQVIGF